MATFSDYAPLFLAYIKKPNIDIHKFNINYAYKYADAQTKLFDGVASGEIKGPRAAYIHRVVNSNGLTRARFEHREWLRAWHWADRYSSKYFSQHSRPTQQPNLARMESGDSIASTGTMVPSRKGTGEVQQRQDQGLSKYESALRKWEKQKREVAQYKKLRIATFKLPPKPKLVDFQ